MEISEWKEHLEMERKAKDRFFAQHRHSPILAEDRIKFQGLNYYPPDSAYRFELELHEHEEKKVQHQVRKHIVQDDILISSLGGILQLRGSGFSTLTRHIIRGASIAKIILVPSCPRKIGLKCQYVGASMLAPTTIGKEDNG